MIGTIEISLQAHNPQFPLHPVNAYINSPSSVRLRDVPKKIGNWKIDRVYIEITYPDETNFTVETKLIGGVYVGTFNGCEIAGTTAKGFVVKADGTDENGLTVDGYILGVGDIYILDSDGRTLPQNPIRAVNLVNGKSPNPHVGDAVWVDGVLEIYDGQTWKKTGSGVVESGENEGYAANADSAEFAVIAQNASYATNADTASFASWAGNVDWVNVENKPNIPTKTSELENDSGYSKVVESTDIPGYAKNSEYANAANAANESTWANEAGKVDWENVENKSDVVVYDTSEESEKKIVIDGREKGNSVLELNSLNGSTIDFKSEDGLFRIDDYGFTNELSDGTKREIFASCSEFDVSGDLKENGKRVATQEYVDSKIASQTSMVLLGEYEDGTAFSFDVVIK